MRRFTLKINARTDYVYDDGTYTTKDGESDYIFEKEISIILPDPNQNFYNNIFTLLRDELLATFKVGGEENESLYKKS